MLKSRRFRTSEMVHQRIKAQNKVFDLYDDIDDLNAQVEDLQDMKRAIESARSAERGETHDISEITLAISYPRDTFRPPSEWDWPLIIRAIYPLVDAEYLCATIPHPDSETW